MRLTAPCFFKFSSKPHTNILFVWGFYFFFNLCGLWFGQVLLEHLSGIVFGVKFLNSLRSLRTFCPGSPSRSAIACARHGSASQKLLSACKAVCVPMSYLLSLCGLWFWHSLFEHLSGIVFVPSIVSDLHSEQRLPVGLALMAYLHFG